MQQGRTVADGRRRPHSARTVVRVVAGLVAALSVVVGILLAVTAVQVASAQHEIEDELNPARVELGRVLALYVDQETGQRGYILTGREEFLDPYDAAGPRIESNLALLRGQVSPEVRAELTTMTDAHQAWLTRTVEPELAAARRGDRDRATALVASGRGKELFDRVRAAQTAADSAIAHEQLVATQRADDLLRRLSILLVLTVVAFLSTTLLATAAFSRTVLRPLAHLGRDSRAVAGGRLDQSVRAEGPLEVLRVGEDVDTMRRHLLDELDASRRATEALTLGEPAVVALQAALTHEPVVRHGLDVAGQIESAQGVLAGDFLDIVELDDQRVAVVLADVAGHGPAAAVVGLRLKTALAAILGQAPLDEVLPRIRDGLVGEGEMFATAFVGIVDLAQDSLTYVNAGHPPPLLTSTRGGAAVELDPTGPLVSPVLAGVGWEVGVRSFGPGDSLLIFSDGVLEARDAGDQEFGLDRVRAALADTRGRPAADVVDRIRAEVRDHAARQRDDVTVLVVRRASVSQPVR
jgi:CHASE3 domain sensor protein